MTQDELDVIRARLEFSSVILLTLRGMTRYDPRLWRVRIDRRATYTNPTRRDRQGKGLIDMGSFADRIRPWECANCGQKNISANKQACPKCHEPRAGSAAAQARTDEESIGQATREYEGEKAMVAGITAMAAQGWRVVSQTSYQPRAGVGRVALLGLGAAVIKPQMRFVVVYSR